MGGGWFALAGRSVCVYIYIYTQICIIYTDCRQFCYWLTDEASERPNDFLRVRQPLRFPGIQSGHLSAPHYATLTSSLQHKEVVPLYFLDLEWTSLTVPTAPSVLPLLTSSPHLWDAQASDPVGESPGTPLQQNLTDSSEGAESLFGNVHPGVSGALGPARNQGPSRLDSMVQLKRPRAEEGSDSQPRAAVCAADWVVSEHT